MAYDSSLNEISTVIGELRSFSAQQIVTNAHILEEIKKISDRVIQYVEINATFIEYRKTLHARFEKMHEQTAEFDAAVEKLDLRVDEIHDDIIAFKTQVKIFFAALAMVATVGNSLFSTFAGAALKLLAHS
jgi:hypothetical protein